VKARLPEQMQGTYDLIFLLTKQLENRKVATFLTFKMIRAFDEAKLLEQMTYKKIM